MARSTFDFLIKLGFFSLGIHIMQDGLFHLADGSTDWYILYFILGLMNATAYLWFFVSKTKVL